MTSNIRHHLDCAAFWQVNHRGLGVNRIKMTSTSTGTGWSCATLTDGIEMMDMDLEAQRLEKAIEEKTTLIRNSDCWGTLGNVFQPLIPQELDEELGGFQLEEARTQVS